MIRLKTFQSLTDSQSKENIRTTQGSWKLFCFEFTAFLPHLDSSVRQTYSALSNLSLNIQGHEEVPKSKFFFEQDLKH